MKLSKKLLAKVAAALLLMPLLTQTSCSSGSSETAEESSYAGIMTTEEFANLRKAFQVFSAGSVYIYPVTLVTPSDQVTSRAEVFGYIAAETEEGLSEPVAVLMSYETSGNALPTDPPTHGTLAISFSSPTGQNNAPIIRALGFRQINQGNVLSELEFDFNFITGSVDIAGAGASGGTIQPGDGGTTESTGSEEKLYNRVFIVQQNNF